MAPTWTLTLLLKHFAERKKRSTKVEICCHSLVRIVSPKLGKKVPQNVSDGWSFGQRFELLLSASGFELITSNLHDHESPPLTT